MPSERLEAALADRYRIERRLGEGGMATVYLAEDLKHKRNVAVKVLRPELAAVLGADRFVQEITTTAALQHPHILPLFDSGTADGFLYYVMPFIDGETLRDKLNRETQLGIDDAVQIAGDVASALDYAHRNGVIHRDIKPENILMHDGRPMVADFGIALAVSAAAGGRMTETGLSLGTPHYMSPEQATAEKDISARSDVYSLGSVLYELLTGSPPHVGASAQQIIMKIVTEEAAPVTTVRKSVPSNVTAAVAKALEKLPADRFASAAEFGAALLNPAFTTIATGTAAAESAVPPSRRSAVTAALVALAIVTTALAVWGWLLRAAPRPHEVVRVEMMLGHDLMIDNVDNHRLAVSPDGRRLAFVGYDGTSSELWVRELDAMNARRLEGTTGAVAPFFSPDGASIGFLVRQAGGADVRVIPAEGGIVRTVVDDSASGYGADWADDGRIYFSYRRYLGLAAVPATGGNVVQISAPDPDSGATEHNFPHVLPGSRMAIVQLWYGSVGANRIGALDLETGAVTELLDGSYARSLGANRLVVGAADGNLSVIPFDPGSGALSGERVPMVAAVEVESGNGTVQFAVSGTGTLVYQLADTTGRSLVWVERDGSVIQVDSSQRAGFGQVAISPEGDRIALAITGPTASSIWVRQLASGTMTRLTFEGDNSDRPIWTPDGSHVVYLGSRDARRLGWKRRADGSGTEEPAVPGAMPLNEIAYHPNGTLVVVRPLTITPRTLYVADLSRDTMPQMLFPVRADHFAATLSPNGRWLAFVSEESGDREVYVRPFPAVDSAQYAISTGGGTEPLWGRSGRELFFRTPRGGVMLASVTTEAAFTHEEPQLLFTAPDMLAQGYNRGWDVTRDGRRFLMIQTTRPEARTLMMVVNWAAEIDRLAGGVK